MALNPGQWVVKAKVTGSMLGYTGTGKEELAVVFDTDDPGVPSITKYLFFTEKAMEMTTKALVTLGWKPEDHDYDITKLDKTDVLVGREANLVLENREYNGTTKAEVVFINSPGGGGVKEAMGADAATAFSVTLRDRLRAERLKAGANPAAQAGPSPAPLPEDPWSGGKKGPF